MYKYEMHIAYNSKNEQLGQQVNAFFQMLNVAPICMASLHGDHANLPCVILLVGDELLKWTWVNMLLILI